MACCVACVVWCGVCDVQYVVGGTLCDVVRCVRWLVWCVWLRVLLMVGGVCCVLCGMLCMMWCVMVFAMYGVWCEVCGV